MLISSLLVYFISCKKTKNENVKKNILGLATPPNSAADVIDPGFFNTYGQIEYLAIAYAIMGGKTSISNTNLFKYGLAAFQYNGANQRQFSNEENVPISQHLGSNTLYNCLSTPRPGLDLSDAITYFLTKPYATPIGNGNPPLPYDDKFMQFFNWRFDQTSKKLNYFTYTEIYNAPDTYGEYEDNAVSFHALPFVVIPVKNFEQRFRVLANQQSNDYLPIKGYYWDNVTNSLKTKTYQSWDDVDAAALVTDYILLVNFERNDYGSQINHIFNCTDIICGDDYCNEHCNDCSSDCNLPKFKLELTEVTISEDSKIYHPNPDILSVGSIPWRERAWDGRYSIHYTCYVVHTDGSIDVVNDAEFSQHKIKKKHVKRTKVDFTNITGILSTKGTSIVQTSSVDLLSNNFRPNFPNGDKIYIMFWEDDPNGQSSLNFIKALPRKNPGNLQLSVHPLVFDYSCRQDENPFGTKYDGSHIFGWNDFIDSNNVVCGGANPCTNGVYRPFPIEDPVFPTISNPKNHVMVIDFSDFTSNSSHTSSEFIFNDMIEAGNTVNNPMRGGKYGVSFKMKWSQKL